MLNKAEKELLTKEFSLVWGNGSKMVNYCVNKTTQFATMPDGIIITVEKQSIETRFCFGESGYDYDEAQDAAEHARTSEDYFTRENMSHFNRWIKDIEEAISDTNNEHFGNFAAVIGEKHYYSQADACRLGYIEFLKWYEVIDALEAAGEPCKVAELPGKRINYRGQLVRVATVDELSTILEAYKAARAEHEKKVKSYLKRYGLSKVHTWTYWRDA